MLKSNPKLIIFQPEFPRRSPTADGPLGRAIGPLPHSGVSLSAVPVGGWPTSSFCTLGLRGEEFGLSGSTGARRSMKILRHIPQKGACDDIPPKRRIVHTNSPDPFPRDRPNLMKDQPPWNDDPNSFPLNPMRLPISSSILCPKESFLENWGWTSFPNRFPT